MTFEKFTIKAQEAVQEAVSTAERNGQQAIEPEHLLKGILVKGKDICNFIFQKVGANSTQIEKVTDSEISHLTRVHGGEPYLSSTFNTVLQQTLDISQKMGDEFVSIEPMLIALLTVQSTASRILHDAGVNEKDLRAAINDAFLVLPDGIGVIYGAKILGTPLKARIPGIDFISALLARMAESGKSVFLFGSKPGVAEAAAENIAAAHPGIVISGTCDGYFTDDGPIIQKINDASPDLLLVCLGAPKQELWMAENVSKLNVRLMAGLGGSLDVFAGNVKRAPKAWQRLGLEWLYRLIKEPRRIKRMIKLPLFVLAVIMKRIRG